MEEEKKNIFSINKISKNDNDIKKRLREKKAIKYLDAPKIGRIYKMKKKKGKVGRPRKKPIEIFLENDDRTITTTGHKLNNKKKKIFFRPLMKKNIINISSKNPNKKEYPTFNPNKYKNENKNSNQNSLVKKINYSNNHSSESEEEINTSSNNKNNKINNNNNNNFNFNKIKIDLEHYNDNKKDNKKDNNKDNNKDNKKDNKKDNNKDNNKEEIKNFNIEIDENKSKNSKLPLNFLYFKPYEKNNFEYIGNIEKDSPLRVADVLQNNDDPRSLYIEIEWKTRKNGIKPKNSTYTNKRIREKFPNFLLDFYEDSLFLSQKRHIELEKEIESKNK